MIRSAIYFFIFFLMTLQALGTVSNLLEYGLKFSLDFSSRPPQIFLPHQKILWTLDAWNSVDAGQCSFVLRIYL